MFLTNPPASDSTRSRSATDHKPVDCRRCGIGGDAADPVSRTPGVRWAKVWPDSGQAAGQYCYYCYRAGFKYFKDKSNHDIDRGVSKDSAFQRRQPLLQINITVSVLWYVFIKVQVTREMT